MEQNPLNKKEDKNVSELMVKEKGELVKNTTEVLDLMIEKKSLLSDKAKLLIARIGRITGFGIGAIGTAGFASMTGFEGYEVLKHANEGLSTVGDAIVMANVFIIFGPAMVVGGFTALSLNDLVEKLKRKIQLASESTKS